MGRIGIELQSIRPTNHLAPLSNQLGPR